MSDDAIRYQVFVQQPDGLWYDYIVMATSPAGARCTVDGDLRNKPESWKQAIIVPTTFISTAKPTNSIVWS